MSFKYIVGVAFFALVCTSFVTAQALKPRSLPTKPGQVLRPAVPSELCVKFRDHLKMRTVGGALTSVVGGNLDALQTLSQTYGLSFQASINLPQEALEKSGRRDAAR